VGRCIVYFIYCGAHRPVLFANALKSIGEKITIITHDREIVKFCEYKNINCINFEFDDLYFRLLHKKGKFFKIIKEIKLLKKTLDDLLKKMNCNNSDKYICAGNRTKAIDAFYLAKELSSICQVYYKDLSSKPNEFKRPRLKPFFRGDITRFLIKRIMGLDLMFYELNSKPLFGVGRDFSEKYNFKEYNPSLSVENLLLQSLENRKILNKKYKNLIILGDLASKGEYTTDHLKANTTKNLFRKILELPVDFSFKKHPDAPPSLPFYSYFESYEEIPTFIPVEEVFPEVEKSIIAVYSISLLTASKLKHLKAISLLEMVEWESDLWKNEMKSWLKSESHNKILFPKNFWELQNLLIDDKYEKVTKENV